MTDPSRQDFGGYLREARERAGITLRTISASTKISVLVLEALERNDFSRLPGGVFTRAFVRSYAREVGLDPEQTLSRFLQQFPDAGGDAELREPSTEGLDAPPRSGGARIFRVVAWMLPILAGIAYFAFLGSRPEVGNRTGTAAERPAVPAPPAPQPPRADREAGATVVPPEAAAPAVASAAEPAAAPEGAGAAPAGAATAPAGAATAPAGAATAPAGAATAPAEAGAGQAAATPAAAQVPEGAVRLTLAATGPCWVSLRSDGQIVFAGLMQAGDRREFDVKGSISLTAGDAATLAFTVNGEQGRSLGGSGAVATVRFSPDTFRSVLAGR